MHFRWLPLLAALILVSRLAFAEKTLQDVCGVEGSTFGPGDDQMERLCSAAYLNGNARFVQDNNARVRASVALSAVPSCMMGNGGACSVAVDNGHLARKNYRAGNQSEESARINGQQALVLASNVSTVERPKATPPPGGRPLNSGFPAECARAATGGMVSDRIACALSTDPTMPDTVRDPAFAANFEKETGVPLQEVINKGPAELMRDYSTPAMERLFGKLKDKMTMAEFLTKRNDLISGLSQRNAMDKATGGGGGAARLPDNPGSSQNLTGMPQDAAMQGPVLGGRAESAAPDAGYATAPEEDRNLSLFVRVSNRYRLVWPVWQSPPPLKPSLFELPAGTSPQQLPPH